jgi:hypothetical protein
MRRAAAFLLLLSLVAAFDVRGTICVTQPVSKVRLIRGVVVILIGDALCPVSGVEVEVRRGKTQMLATSDEDGYFAFSRTPDGPYRISARLEGADGFENREIHVQRAVSAEDVLLIGMELSSLLCGGSMWVATSEEALAIQQNPACKPSSVPVE